MSAMRGWENVKASELERRVRISNGLARVAKPTKYRNKKCIVEGEHFDSIHEGECWIALRAREQAHQIRDLRRQVKYDLCAYDVTRRIGVTVATYIADFVYWDVADEREHVIDAKGFVTKEFTLKSRWFAAQYGVAIELV